MKVVNDKFVGVKLPLELHTYLKEKAKEKSMAFGNYLFMVMCEYHNIEYKPASFVLPNAEATDESPVSEEIQKDIENMEQEESSGSPEGG